MSGFWTSIATGGRAQGGLRSARPATGDQKIQSYAIRSPASSANWRRPSVCLRATARVGRQKRRPQPRRRQWRGPLQRDHVGARALHPRNQLMANAACRASAIRCLPWQPARRSRKSPLHAKALARTMSAPPFPGTSGVAASKSATGSSTARSRRGRSKASRSRCRDEKDRRAITKGAGEWTGSSLS